MNTGHLILDVKMLMSIMNENRVVKPKETGVVGYLKTAASFLVKHIGKACVNGG
jgi:hypothetical protein